MVPCGAPQPRGRAILIAMAALCGGPGLAIHDLTVRSSAPEEHYPREL